MTARASRLRAVPMTISEANSVVTSYHRHSRPVLSALFAVGCSDGAGLQGVAIVGRPVSRMLQDGETAEVVRVCALPEARKGSCSFLYGACWRAARALGWRRLVTYTLASESGASLRGAGWRVLAELPARGPGAWHGPDRSRDWQPVYGQLKLRWEVEA